MKFRAKYVQSATDINDNIYFINDVNATTSAKQQQQQQKTLRFSLDVII